jgi:hypothetical protein
VTLGFIISQALNELAFMGIGLPIGIGIGIAIGSGMDEKAKKAGLQI